jgi:hypothetical protein
MARPHVVTALEGKYARLLGCQRMLRRPSLSITGDLEHIEAVMRLFDPHWDKAGVRPIAPRFPSRWRKKGEGVRAAFAVIKAAQTPLSATEIAHGAYLVAGLTPPCVEELRIVGTDLVYSLRNHWGEALVMVEGRPRLWWVDSESTR